MKAYTALTLAFLIVSVSMMASPALALNEPSVGVKKGDWMEYSVIITRSTPAPAHNISWFRMEIMDVEGAVFQANVTVKNVNGTFSSSIWDFNFTQGEVEGWVIIPANLDVGSTFYDAAKPGNVTIEGQEQKVVAGATRTVTHAHDSERIIKEWDKATGFYTYSIEKPKNFTVISQAIATNMWNAEVLEQNPVNNSVAAVISIAVLALLSALIVAKRKSIKKASLPSILQRRIRSLTILLTILLMGGAIVLINIFQSQITMSFHEVNLIMQTIWCGLLVVSMWFRAKGSYLLHGVTWTVVVTITLLNFAMVLLMTPPSSTTSMDIFFTSPAYAAEFISHAILSFPALILGVWFIVLWSPNSTSFVAKTRRIAPITTVLWVLSYIAGVLGYIALYTNYFG
jgi:uncharacterized membrane protein YozB (DUF420 family)